MVFEIILMLFVVVDFATNILLANRYGEQNKLLKAQNEVLKEVLEESTGFAHSVFMAYKEGKENDKTGSDQP